MARATAMANQVAAAIVAKLGTITATNPAYLSTPRKVRRGIPLDWSTAPVPALFVRTVRWGPNEPGTASQHRAQAEYEVLCVTNGPPDSGEAERVLLEMTADVAVALAGDFQLGGVLTSGWIHLLNGYEPYATADVIANGLAVAGVTLSATWEWTPAAP